jgi:hypothetical protein
MRTERLAGGIRWAVLAAVTLAMLTVAPPAAHAGDGFFTRQNLHTTSHAPISFNAYPTGWTTPWDQTRHIAYVNGDGTIIAGAMPAGGSWAWWHTPSLDVRYTRLTAYAYSWDRSSHIIYDNGFHIHELWWSEASPKWQDVDLTAQTGGWRSAEIGSGYEQGGDQHIVFNEATLDSHVWELRYTPGAGWRAEDLSVTTHTTPSQRGFAVGIGRGDNFGEAVAYVASDNKIHLLSSANGTDWVDQPIAEWAHAPAPDTGIPRMDMFQSSGSFELSIVYNTKSGAEAGNQIHLLSWSELKGWTDVDVGKVTGYQGRTSAEPRASFFFEADASDHIFTVDNHGAIVEFVRSRSDQWFVWKDTEDGAAYANVGAFFSPDDRFGLSYTENVAFPDTDGALNLMELTAPTT